jgi:hypothetical protein
VRCVLKNSNMTAPCSIWSKRTCFLHPLAAGEPERGSEGARKSELLWLGGGHTPAIASVVERHACSKTSQQISSCTRGLSLINSHPRCQVRTRMDLCAHSPSQT